MYLTCIDDGQPLSQRVVAAVRRRLGLMGPTDITKTMRFRPEFFGGPLMALYNAVMRGPSEWSIGERELMAAFTSKLNQCPF